jgi:hypothetical protein
MMQYRPNGHFAHFNRSVGKHCVVLGSCWEADKKLLGSCWEAVSVLFCYQLTSVRMPLQVNNAPHRVHTVPKKGELRELGADQALHTGNKQAHIREMRFAAARCTAQSLSR